MPGEITNLKNLARRVKEKALKQAEAILDDPDHAIYSKEIYDHTYLTVLKNAVPRTQEVTGEDGEPIKLAFDPAFNGTSSKTETNSPESSPI